MNDTDIPAVGPVQPVAFMVIGLFPGPAAGEMVNVLEAERSFEAAQKVLTAIDQTAQQANSKMSEFK